MSPASTFRGLVVGAVFVSMPLWPRVAHGAPTQGLPALRARDQQAPKHHPNWPQPTLPQERMLDGAEPIAMLPAEQHMGEFSEKDLRFIARAAMVHQTQEIYAKLALRRAQSADIRNLAQKLTRYHRRARTALASVVQPHGVVLPSGIDTEHQWLRAHLQEADAKGFDRLYLKSQIEEHARAVVAFREQVNHGKSAPLRAWARDVLAGLEEHQQALESLYAPKPVS